MRTFTPRKAGHLRPAFTAIGLIALAGISNGCSTHRGAVKSAASTQVVYSTWVDVRHGDLTTSVPYSGDVVYASSLTVQSPASGVITNLPDIGTTVRVGEALFSVDEHPVLILPGQVPVYRDLALAADGSPVTGSDVKQLQEYLASTGYFHGARSGLFTPALGAAVRRWRLAKHLGDGQGLAKSDVVFLPGNGPWTVTKQVAALGSSFSGGEVVDVSAGSPVIRVELDDPPPEGATYVLGAASGTGSIQLSTVGAAARDDSGKYVQTLAGPADGGPSLDLGSSVDVDQQEVLARDVDLVPIAAIRLDASGHTVVRCRLGKSGRVTTCPVQIGAADDTDVAIRSGLSDDQQVATAP